MAYKIKIEGAYTHQGACDTCGCVFECTMLEVIDHRAWGDKYPNGVYCPPAETRAFCPHCQEIAEVRGFKNV